MGAEESRTREADSGTLAGADEGRAGGAAAAPEREEHYDFTTLPKVRTWGVMIAIAVAACAFVGLFLLGWMPRHERLKELVATTAAHDERPTVDAAKPKLSAAAFDLRLPADVRSMQQTSIYARTSGYLKRNVVDIGDRVEAGALLAEIDTPDVDAELQRAIAGVALAKASLPKAQDDLALADTTLKRWAGMAETGGVTKQQFDEKRSTFTQAQFALDAAKANVGVAEAEVKRLTVLQQFERIVAPFAGTITARNYDVGALITPTNSGEGRELYRLDKLDALRVFVNVPQAHATGVKIGEDAFLSVRNYPGREFVGKVARSAGAIDPSTRSLRFQIDVPNADGALYSGMYGEVRLPITTAQATLVVPTSALVFGADGTSVWVLDGNRARRRKVTVGQDFGTELEVSTGLTGQEVVIKNPGERLVEGEEVRLVEQPHAQDAGGTGKTAAER